MYLVWFNAENREYVLYCTYGYSKNIQYSIYRRYILSVVQTCCMIYMYVFTNWLQSRLI